MKNRNRKLILFILSGFFIFAGLTTSANIETRGMGVSRILAGIEIILAIFVYGRIKKEKRNLTLEIILLILMLALILLMPMNLMIEQPFFIVPLVVIGGIYINKNIKYNMNIGLKIILYFLILCCLIMIKRGFDSLIVPSNITISDNNEQKCVNYENEIKNNLDSTKRLLEVFYSPVTQTCLYTTEQFNIIEVNDYLKQENLLRFDNEKRCTEIRGEDTKKLEACNKIYQEERSKLIKLKGE